MALQDKLIHTDAFILDMLRAVKQKVVSTRQLTNISVKAIIAAKTVTHAKQIHKVSFNFDIAHSFRFVWMPN